MADSYYDELPESEDIRERFQFAYDYWQPRNDFIEKMRKMLSGDNPIQGPPNNVPYKVRVIHSYTLASVVNEKAARFTQLPLIQVVPEDENIDARSKSSELETSINIAFHEMERRSDGDVWARAALDAIVIDEGVERIERAPAAFWREAIRVNDDGSLSLLFEKELDGMNTALKKKAGIPIRSVYVPLENFYPIYEGPTIVESFETELRTMRSVLRNPLFAERAGVLRMAGNTSDNDLKQQVTIIHYVNLKWHAYYAMTPGSTVDNPSEVGFPNSKAQLLSNVGQPILLYAYEHKLGTSMYNCIPGRFGGWKTNNNRIEGVGKGLLELNQGIDELLSQVTTNVRAKYWPSLKQKINPELRGYTDSNTSEPKAITVQEGQSIAIYTDEDIEPLFQPVDDPAVPWLFDQLQMQIARLGGSPALYGQNTPGVETGYHQSLQITQAEHLDEKIEQHLSIGATRRAELILRHIIAMNLGPVWVHATQTLSNGKKTGKYKSINPEDLSPLPRLDAQVRRPRPVDLAASIRAAREASDERQGKGPLLSDDSIRQDFLNITAPDVEKHKIMVEAEQVKLIQSGVLSQKIAQGLNLLLATEGVPAINNPAEASPAALEAARQLAGGGTPSGMPNPQANEPAGIPPGQTETQAQPEQAAGQEIANAMFG